MRTLSLRLTTKSGALRGQLAVVCSTKEPGKPQKRHYKVVQGLESPDYSPLYWNEAGGIFIAGPFAAQNNHVIKKLLDDLQELIDSGQCLDGRQLFDIYEAQQAKTKYIETLTLGRYVEKLVDELKFERKSSNYEVYNTLYNNLVGINKKIKRKTVRFTPASFQGIKLFDTPLAVISNRHFIVTVRKKPTTTCRS